MPVTPGLFDDAAGLVQVTGWGCFWRSHRCAVLSPWHQSVLPLVGVRRGRVQFAAGLLFHG
jgi:hypothetical protein